MADSTDGFSKSAIKSVTSDGESVTLDSNRQKSEERQERNDDLANVLNRRVRPFTGRIKMRGIYG